MGEAKTTCLVLLFIFFIVTELTMGFLRIYDIKLTIKNIAEWFRLLKHNVFGGKSIGK